MADEVHTLFYIDKGGFPQIFSGGGEYTPLRVPHELGAMLSTWIWMPASHDDSLLSGIIFDWIKSNWDELTDYKQGLVRLTKYMRACSIHGGFRGVEKLGEEVIHSTEID